jgi:hypothetical protein
LDDADDGGDWRFSGKLLSRFEKYRKMTEEKAVRGFRLSGRERSDGWLATTREGRARSVTGTAQYIQDLGNAADAQLASTAS